ncbi:MAG: iron export ABC transporter permease subunit FetB [Planctomycetota bacterium]|nr:iron export ABC transporter permease subunit FetB [Planctomycetota bacterium]
MIAAIDLGPRELSLAAILILLNAGVSMALRLRMERSLLLAGLRAVLQLSVLGLVLEWVFDTGRWQLVLALTVAMAVMAGFEAVRRTTHRVPGGWMVGVSVMVVGSMTVTFYATAAVLRIEPWYAPQYLVPIMGMVLGNTLNGISLGLETSLAGFRSEREQVEMLLAHGATRAEASRDVVHRAVRMGLLPVVNMLIAAGLISIPGMMTGQILAGESPLSAARYQIFILFIIAGGTAAGTLTIVLLSARLVFDDRDRLRADRIRRLKE